MKLLYISGNKGSGKTPAFVNLDTVISKKYKKSKQSFNYFNLPDFVNFYTGKAVNGQYVAIILNSACDLVCMIEQFMDALKKFLNSTEFQKCSEIILITAIRNEGDEIRQLLENELNKLFPDKEIIEIPLSRVNEKSDITVHSWYHNKIDELVIHTLNNPPFEIL